MDPSDSITRELTLEEAIEVAILLQKHGRYAEAGTVYDRVLAVSPEHPRALHYAGVLAHQDGRHDTALALIERSLRLAPDYADGYSNLGIVLQAAGRLDEAIAAYRRAIALDPRHANAHSNLGVLLRATGHLVEAEASYRTAIAIDPRHADAYTNLGVLLNGVNRHEEAAACFCKVITLRPRDKDARRLLALAHCVLGDVAEAVKIYDEWLAEEPGDPIARHMHAACTGREIPPRASDGFVTRTFDSFAASFDAKLQRLSYRAPALVAAMIQDAGVVASKSLDVLDAGCGTGLCGPLLAPYARRLTGVDLSDAMLAHARAKQVYDTLARRELTSYLREHRGAFDLIVAADTLVYFGVLQDVFTVAAGALRPRGLFVFTLEHSSGAGSGYQLELHGRYSHSRTYVTDHLTAAGFQSTVADADLRLEAGAPVPGLVVRAQLGGDPLATCPS